MPIMTATDIAAFAGTVYQDALFVARDNNLMAQLVTVFGDRTGIAPRKNSEYGTVTMQSVAETDDLSSQTLTPSVIATLTPGEVAAQFFVSDTREETDPFGARNDAAMELGMGMAQKMETDLLTTFTSFTGGTVGAAGSAVTWSHFFAAESILRAQNAPFPYVAVMHPYHWHNLAKAVSVAGAQNTPGPAFQDEIMRNWWVSRVGPVDIFVTSNITTGTAASWGMFSPAAAALDVRRAPRLEPERDASRRGVELNMSALYAYGVWRPRFGVKATGDASTPS